MDSAQVKEYLCSRFYLINLWVIVAYLYGIAVNDDTVLINNAVIRGEGTFNEANFLMRLCLMFLCYDVFVVFLKQFISFHWCVDHLCRKRNFMA